MKYITILITLIFLTGCAVHYGPRIPGFVPGYVDKQLGEQTYQVKIGESWPKDWPDLEKFAMYRAAEITKAKGCRYFVITDSSTLTSTYTINTPATTHTTGTASLYGSTAYLNTTSVTTGGNPAHIQGGWYILEFKVLNESDLAHYDKVVDANMVISNLKYFIDSRR